MRKIYERFRTIFGWLLLAVFTGLIGEAAIEIARKYHFFERSTASVEAVLSFLAAIRDLPGFWPILSFATGLAAGMWLDYLVLRHTRTSQDKKTVSELEIVYDPKDRKFLSRMYPHASLEMVTRFKIGVHSLAHYRSINDVIVSVDRNLIVENTIEVAWNGKLVRNIPRINPGVTEYVELFGIGDNFPSNDPRDIFSKPQRFTIRASANHTRETTAEFEFDIRANPKLRRIS